LRIEQPGAIAGVGRFHPPKEFVVERDAYVISLSNVMTWVDLSGDRVPRARPR
jgi:hypothetical protein